MGQRTKNRISEHSGPGHDLKKSKTNHQGIKVVSSNPAMDFYKCSCGWEGWLSKNLNDPE